MCGSEDLHGLKGLLGAFEGPLRGSRGFEAQGPLSVPACRRF